MSKQTTNQEPIDERELYQKIQSDPSWVFDQLFTRYSEAIYGHLLQLLPTKEDAEEALQDSFVKIWKNLESYDPSKGRLFTWMLRIARNTGIDLIRKNKKNQSSDLDKVTVNIPADNAKLMDHGLLKVLNQLQDDRKFVVYYLVFNGYTQQEVSDEFGIPLGTVKSRFRAAMVDLRKLLRHEQLIFLLIVLSWL